MNTTKYILKTPIRWGFIGCGAVTEIKSGPAYKMTSDFEVIMVMRRNLEKAKNYAQRHGIVSYTDNAQELIENPEVDAVYIATPPDTHKYYGLQVAEAGKPCCIEKPMAPTYKDSLAIYEAFQAKKVPLFIAYYRRSLPRFLKVKSLLEDHAIGTIRHIHWFKSKPPNEVDVTGQYNWRTDANIASGGYFDDLASHGLDLFCFLLGNIKEVSGQAINQQNLYKAYDAISASWLHENGITGTGSWNFGTWKREDKVEIFGSEGSITFSVLDEAPIALTTKTGAEHIAIANPKHIQQYHAENIRKHLQGEQLHPSTGETALHTAWIMSAILDK